MKINPNTNYSALFSSLGVDNSTTSFLSDYASIKNGSYGKLMKAYYKNEQGTSKQTASTNNSKKKISEEETKSLSAAKTSAEDLKASIENITSVVEDGGDAEKLAGAVKSFADKYNKFVAEAGKTSNSSITRTGQSMINSVASNLSLLSKAGIKLNESGKMSVDEETVKKSASTVKTLFGGVGTFGDNIAAKATSVANKATSSLNVSKTYKPNASYDNSTYVGKIYDSYN